MTRAAGWTALALVLFSALLLALGWMETHGFMSSDVTQLWAKAIVHNGSAGRFIPFDAFYPPAPYALTLMIQSFAGGTGVPSPFLLSAALGAAILALWLRNLWLNGGISLTGSCMIVALLGLNPFFLRALADGPESMFTMLGTWVFARGIVNLRITGNAPDMMKVAVGLLIVALSDNYGLMISLGALPFLIVAARPSMISNSSFGYLLAMFYPVAAALGSLFFVSAIFNSTLVPQIIEGPSQITAAEHLRVLSGIVPVALAAVFRTIMTPSLFMPLFAALGSVLGAYALNIYLHVESDPIVAIAPTMAVVAVGIRFWPPTAVRTPISVALLTATVVYATHVFRETSIPESREWWKASMAVGPEIPNPTAQAAAFLDGKLGVMVDAERNPEIVVAMGDLTQLVISGDPVYDWALEGGLLQAPFVVVAKLSGQSQIDDRILLRFPQFEQDRVPGYNQIYENSRWRVFEHTGPEGSF